MEYIFAASSEYGLTIYQQFPEQGRQNESNQQS
jgi:hypothetical protein